MNNLPKVIYENKDLLVLDKPWGMVVNKADTTEGSLTLQAWVEKYLNLNDLGIAGRAGIVHRLDKDTSGVIVIAKTESAFSELQAQFKDRAVVKKYKALVHGLVDPTSGSINAPIDRNPFNRERFGVFPGGKEAITDYKTIENFQLPITDSQYKNYKKLGSVNYTLLELTPHTGRTHQIRVHLKHLGYPIVSDEFYVGRKLYRLDSKWCPRQFLHAFYLRISGMDFNSPEPSDLQQALNVLSKLTR